MFDIVILSFIIYCTIIGGLRGFFKELVISLGYIVITILSYSFMGYLAVLCYKVCPFFSYNGLDTLNLVMYQLVSFLIIFGVLSIIFNIILKITNMLEKFMNLTIILGAISKMLGAILGFVEGLVLAHIMALVFATYLSNNDHYHKSKIVPIVNNKYITIFDKKFYKSVKDISNIKVKNYSKEEINQIILTSMTKNKLITKKQVIELIDSGKLKKEYKVYID